MINLYNILKCTHLTEVNKEKKAYTSMGGSPTINALFYTHVGGSPKTVPIGLHHCIWFSIKLGQGLHIRRCFTNIKYSILHTSGWFTGNLS